MQRGVLGPSRCLRRAFAIAVRRCRQGAQNGSKRLVRRGVLGLSRCLRDCSPQVPPGRSKWLFGPALVLPVHSKRLLGLLESDSVPPGRSKWLKKVQKCSKRRKEAQKGARKGCSSLPGAASVPKRLFERASVPPVRSKRLFETAVRDHYSKVLGSATLCSAPLYSALLCSVHVYARVHTSICIDIR